ncbi:MAG TPA: ATP-dependent helicase HrpB [Azospirillaceae bacterium]|nr:ATP-dependent helicase HrpB [Azospirillaceae bacterium]
MPAFPPLPIDPVLPDLLAALDARTEAVLEAPPGAGKTTRVPLALLDAPWMAGRSVIVLEPRRLAARAAAKRMAELLGEPVGATAGYRVRLDSRVGPGTRIEVVTEGLFLRRLQDDPALEGVGAVLFDEFHERNLDADLALALTLEARAALRPDLRLLAMSATLDGAAVAKLLADAPVVTSQGRAFPVEVRYIDPGSGRIEDAVAAAVRRALREEEGSVLVFLPGVREIRRVQGLLEDAPPPGVRVAPLYGDLPLEHQDEAVRPAPDGWRKVVLATSIAETSLTIEGVRVVIDSGLMRVPRFDPRSGMGRLETVRVSLAAAEQRRGRAGRLAPGVCWRLWPEPETRALKPYTEPEIRMADLAPMALELAVWGADPADLAWMDPPPAPGLAQARDLLYRLGALDAGGRVTPHGRAMAALGVHPRLAHMLVRGKAVGQGALACDVAALLDARDIVRGEGAREADLRVRLDILRGRERAAGDRGADRGAVQQVREAARQLRRQLGVPGDAGADGEGAGLLLALAYPDRVAQRRGPPGSFRLANGRGASLPPTDPLCTADWLAVADLDGDAANARIFRCAPVTQAELEQAFGDDMAERAFVEWDAREQAVAARRQRRLGALVLADAVLADPPMDAVVAALLQGIRQGWPHILPWTDAATALRARMAFCARLEPGSWPDWSDAGLLATLEDWLAPHLSGMSRAPHLKRLDMADILLGSLDWPRRQRFDALAPTHVTVPTGNRREIDYSGPEPVLAVKLQEMFGARTGPAVGDGKVPVLLHLLSPAGRPVQVTRDLAGFWAGSYAAVRADLRGRYPKHPWPEDPQNATPTARAKPRGT